MTGVMAFAIDLAVTMAALPLVHYLVANSAGFLVANAAQFVVAHTWVFGRSLRDRDLPRLYAVTLAISGAGLAASNAIVWLGFGVMGAPLVPVKMAAAVLVLLLNFGLRRAFAYR
ncbi:MAG TPA: GtrA family protein [Usitatibacter sp.]|nr:GtrA family protein [Usitatibacter sp.]